MPGKCSIAEHLSLLTILNLIVDTISHRVREITLFNLAALLSETDHPNWDSIMEYFRKINSLVTLKEYSRKSICNEILEVLHLFYIIKDVIATWLYQKHYFITHLGYCHCEGSL